eukprot:499480-Prorocentrum_minimum.AAC.1
MRDAILHGRRVYVSGRRSPITYGPAAMATSNLKRSAFSSHSFLNSCSLQVKQKGTLQSRTNLLLLIYEFLRARKTLLDGGQGVPSQCRMYVVIGTLPRQNASNLKVSVPSTERVESLGTGARRMRIPTPCPSYLYTNY